jgi:protease-4
MNQDQVHRAVRWTAYIVFWGLVPLVLGTVLSVLVVPVPQVAVIRFQDMIWSGSIEPLGELLQRALDDRRIRAVVLEIDSPGGEVTATEEIYYQLLQFRQSKPLVVTVDYMAASGGYYMAAAGDYVFAKPASMVGNIGVISFLPSSDEQRFTDEDYVSTGPFKFSGGSRGDYMRQIELAKQGFLEAVYAQRGDRLDVDRETLASGEIFVGLQAVRLGLIDELGANSEAIERAASMAHLAHYRVVTLTAQDQGAELYDIYERLESQRTSDGAGWGQGLYYLYLEPRRRTQ